MSEYPILFKPEMIRAILDGRKTQTRRLSARWAKVAPGDRLWVKEGFATDIPGCGSQGGVSYRVDHVTGNDGPTVIKWRSPLFMPRRLARIILEVVERRWMPLHDISEGDAQAEGCDPDTWIGVDGCRRVSYAVGFRALWDSINVKRAPWASNPMVHAITFRRVKG